ncbi:M10 family metallopeptidase C-terminal domain-containing protein [Sphingomonas sp.]|uniref:M10 family metallopeptidase C-terminal domain-containing protein n=1 Tax=Sphingomonas sp. TaxID=28214 RepID=UPI002DD61F22|nr:M10 family metallopeptidase C-terminal domain-containing protein [Sphingomonas sp.]
MANVTLSLAEITAALTRAGIRLGGSQFTFSLPTAASLWPGYAAGTEPFSTYSIVTPEQAAAFRAALAAWDELIAPDFTEVADNAAGRGEVRVAFTSHDMANDTAAYAYSGSPQAPGGKTGDVWINADMRGESFATGTYNYEVLVHELGHVMGLTHSFGTPPIPAPFENTRYTVMSYTEAAASIVVTFRAVGNSIRADFIQAVAITPMVLDIAAVQAIYGADTKTRSGDTVYRFDQDAATFQSIYDAGGIDTIDLSNFTRPNIVDLTPGGYSTIGLWSIEAQTAYWVARFPSFQAFIQSTLQAPDTFTRTDNLGIALGTLIENVTGGSAADRITGNDAANRLMGMDGDDTLMGGAGDDWLYGGNGGDVIEGGDGDDVIEGGAGGDRLTGGAGADIFVFREARDGDVITDFSMSEDFIDLDGRQFTTLTYGPSGLVMQYNGGLLRLDGVSGYTLAEVNARLVTPVPAGPAPIALWPADGDAGVSPVADIRIVFAAAVARGSGTIALRSGDGTPIETFDIAGSRVTIAGNVVTIDPARPLVAGVNYVVSMTAGAVTVGGVAAAAISNYEFATAASPPVAARFQLLVTDAATVSGSGTVFGIRGSLQDVTVLDTPGQVTFDPSFNGGGDRVRLAGAAGDYTVSRSGSTVLLNDGDSAIAIPVGPAAVDIHFADGVRTLILDTAAGAAKLGGQVIGTSAAIVTAAPGTASVSGSAGAAPALLQMIKDGSATAHGTVTVLGARDGVETVAVAKGASVAFDPSFNAGRDRIDLSGDAATYSAVRNGSTIVLTSGSERVTIPVGVTGATIRFDDAERVLVFDTATQTMRLGGQAVTAAGVQVAAAGTATGVAIGGSQNAADGDYRYTHAGDAAQGGTIAGFGRGDSLALSGEAARYVFAGQGGDVTISYVRADGTLATTTLTGIADPAAYIHDRASAEAAAGFGLFV